ncbi:tubulin monoglutamylase TTLL4 isoform X2 [Frankliniella occidentalis]|uniref:Tubulin monoglutamylase TTLL4 isoform X2 n=1 Tax=Frankliniella occidentalis TaxID=133901 RepID=A0A9C6U7J6_FRAOC|nr:tubulin monoglutamylase TTLL4 isoform X2 [Frankliniella occidentalis]
MNYPGSHGGRRRCKSEGIDAVSVTNAHYEQSYCAEIQRPLSRVRFPSPGRKPFQSVNATDLQYLNGSLPRDWNAQAYKTAGKPRLKAQYTSKWSHESNFIDSCTNGHLENGNFSSVSPKIGQGHKNGNGFSGYHRLVHQTTEANPHPEERYLQEIETLRSKLHGLEHLRGLSDNKRARERSDSELSSATTSPPDPRHNHHSIKKEVKRARDFVNSSPKSQQVPSELSENGKDSKAGLQFDSNKSPNSIEKDGKAEKDAKEVAAPTKSDVKTKKIREYPGPHSLDGLRPSLFPNVPPYIRFSLHDQKGPALPPTIQRNLKWNLSTITPLVVRRTVLNSGFRLIRKSNEWTGTWGKHMKSINFKVLKEYQKINHFPGTFQIGRKDRLWRNLFKLMAKFGKKEFGFIPRTYVLPQDSKMLRAAWERSNGKEAWIIKPPASARGTGIKVIHRWGQIPKKRPLVVQKYVDRPYLINGCKFDLRLYILVTSMHPLRIYLYDDGLVRFASVKYSEDPASLADRYMHLTNYSINKLSSHYTHNEDESACKGHKWTIKSLWKYLGKFNIDVDSLWQRLVDLAVKTVISGESSINQLTRAHVNSRYCCYEIFGLDVLLDQDLKPWLLEVNISPSLHSSSPLDLAVKGPMVRDLMNMAGHQIPCKLSPSQQEELSQQYNRPDLPSLCLDKRLYTVVLSAEERNKHILHQSANCREEYLPTILNDLTADDVRHLIQYEDELTQCGRFQKIFPTTSSHTYHQFFEAPRYYNMLFDAWETKYHTNRRDGIQRLQELCEQKLHLQIPAPSTKAKCCTNPLNMEAGMRAPVEAGISSSNSSVDTLTRTAKKRFMSSKEGSPTLPQSPRNSSLYLWSSARIKLSAARLRSHKLLTQKNRPLSYLSRLSCGDSSSKSHSSISEPVLKESLVSVAAPAAGS